MGFPTHIHQPSQQINRSTNKQPSNQNPTYHQITTKPNPHPKARTKRPAQHKTSSDERAGHAERRGRGGRCPERLVEVMNLKTLRNPAKMAPKAIWVRTEGRTHFFARISCVFKEARWHSFLPADSVRVYLL